MFASLRRLQPAYHRVCVPLKRDWSPAQAEAGWSPPHIACQPILRISV